VDRLVGDWPGKTCIYIPSLLVDHHIPEMEKNDGYDRMTPEFSQPKPSILGACSKDA
jgi:hypothetical protein